MAMLTVSVASCSKPFAPVAPDAPPTSSTSASGSRAPEPESPASTSPLRMQPRGKPAPTAVCGHAVAFAGWRSVADATRTKILACDPGDNVIEGRTKHGWNAKPREIPVRFGKRRPNVVLLPAGAFTVTGAVLVRPSGPDSASAPPTDLTATGMPDLSQDLHPAYRGLCGPTSAADLLFFMALRRAEILPGYPSGPSVTADEGVTRLVMGASTSILSESLAGRMGISRTGQGASNIGMRDGLASWLEEHDAGRWKVELDWFDDEEKSAARQKDFFGRLSGAIADGGGAILCLWPGSEFSDAPVEPSAQSADVVADGAPPPAPPAAEFPALPAAASPPPALPGNPSAGPSPQQALERARSYVSKARADLAQNKPKQSFDHAARAVAVLRQHGADTPETAALATDALSVCREAAERLPQPSGTGPSAKITMFQ